MQRPNMFLQIGGFWGTSEFPSQGRNILSEVDWKAVRFTNTGNDSAVATNIKRYDLKRFDADDLDAIPQRAIGLAYSLKARDSQASEWQQIISAEEKAHRDTVLADYQAAKAELEETPENERTPEQKSRLVDITQKISDLTYANSVLAAGSGFLENPPNPFGDGSAGLYHSLSVPNIPFEYRSNFTIAENEPFTLWLYRFKVDEEQVTPELSWEWGRFRFTITEAGIKLVKFNATYTDEKGKKKPLDLKARQGFETLLEQLRDEGRLTAADKRTIQQKKDAIKAVKKAIKDSGRTTKQITADEQAQIDALQKAIDDLKESKRHTPSDTLNLIQSLEDILYADTATVTLNETSSTLYSTPLKISFIPQRAGYLIINLEGSTAPFVYEDRELIRDYHETTQLQTLWKRTGFTLKSNGGAVMWNTGKPVFAKEGTMKTKPFPWAGEGSNFSLSTVFDTPENTGINVEVISDGEQTVSVNGHTASKGPAAHALVTLSSDGEHTPFLFGANIFLRAAERSGDNGSVGNLVWDSESYSTSQGGSYIVDVVPTHEEGRVSYEITLLNPGGLLNLPAQLNDRLCHLQCDDPQNPGEKISLIKNGLIKSVTYEDLASLEIEGLENAEGTVVRLVVIDYFALLEEDTVTETVIGDGQYLSEHLFNVLAGRGFYEAELPAVNLPGEKKLPQGLAYQKPLVQPSQGTDRASYVKGLLDSFGMGLRLVVRDGKFILETPTTTPVAAFTSDGKGSATSSRHLVAAPLNVPIDQTSFFNFFRVEGAIQRDTKERIVREYEISESIYKPGHVAFIGRKKAYPTLRDDALKSEADVIWALRSLVKEHGKIGVYTEWQTFFHPTLRVGDWITINGVPVEITRIPSASWSDDSMTLQVRRNS